MYVAFTLLAALVGQIAGHGMMLEPPNRSSLWRFDSSSPPNYNDNGVFCGGKGVQFDQFGGKCGVCGDPYGDPHPQNNENTGKYGQGKVVRTYKSGGLVDIFLDFEQSHQGGFHFDLCVLSNVNAPEPESCFQPLTFGDGTSEYDFSGGDRPLSVNTTVRLPSGLTCDRCVLRWHYRGGNQWGMCDNGQGAVGCGAQETFRNCADIAIQ